MRTTLLKRKEKVQLIQNIKQEENLCNFCTKPKKDNNKQKENQRKNNGRRMLLKGREWNNFNTHFFHRLPPTPPISLRS